MEAAASLRSANATAGDIAASPTMEVRRDARDEVRDETTPKGEANDVPSPAGRPTGPLISQQQLGAMGIIK
jgi:hypothetical protein